VLYALPLLQGWWGFVGATALVAVIVVAFDMDY
jgi:hypothetical protein